MGSRWPDYTHLSLTCMWYAESQEGSMEVLPLNRMGMSREGGYSWESGWFVQISDYCGYHTCMLTLWPATLP